MGTKIRTVKPDLFKHEELFDLEEATGLPVRLSFIGLFCLCDREGRFKWRPRTLKTDVLPWDDVDFGDVLDALESGGFVESYEVAGEKYGFVPSWFDNQKPNHKEAASRIPAPPKPDDPPVRTLFDGQADEPAQDEPADETEDLVAELWAAYPRKAGKGQAERAIRAALKKVDAETLREAVGAFSKAVAAWPKGDRRYVPHAATWFNGERWTDDRGEWKRHQGGIDNEGRGNDVEAGF